MIFRYDIRYAIAKIPVKLAFRANFRKLVFVDKEKNVPHGKPVIFTPNHRNALIDALLLVYSSRPKRQVVFLARADIFKKKIVAWILTGLRIMPVFRIRDGKDNLDKNTEIFDTAGRILKKNNPIALFPEARHNPKQSLLPIQKAVPRIVLPTEAQQDFNLNSLIVPVAIYYKEIFAFLSDVYVRFGTPIDVSKYKSIYNENPNLAINQLRKEIEDSMKEIIVNIWNDDYYNQYQWAIDWNAQQIAEEKFSSDKDGYALAAQYVLKQLDALFENDKPAFDAKIADFDIAKTILDEHELTTKDQVQNTLSGGSLWLRKVALALSFPIALFGFINAIFPILLNKKLLSLFKDKQFIPSVRYASGLIFIPVFDLIQSLIIGFVTENWIVALAYFFLMPLSFLFAIHWRRWFKNTQRAQKVADFAKRFPEKWKKLVSLIRL